MHPPREDPEDPNGAICNLFPTRHPGGPRGHRGRARARDPDPHAGVRRLQDRGNEVPRRPDRGRRVHQVPPQAGRLRAAPAGRPDDPREAALRRRHTGAARSVRRRGREVRAPEQGPRDHPPEHPDAPHPAAGNRAGDPRARRRRALQPRGLRQHGPQRDRGPVGGGGRGRAVRHDRLRRRLHPLLRPPPHHPGDAAQGQDRLRRQPRRPRHLRDPRHRLPRQGAGDRGSRRGQGSRNAGRRRHLDHAPRGPHAVRLRGARQRRLPEGLGGRVPHLRPPGVAARQPRPRPHQGVRGQVRHRRAAQPGRGGAEGRLGRRTRRSSRSCS